MNQWNGKGDDDRMKQLGDEINTSILKIASQVEETESEFIFRFLSDLAHSTYQVVIEKEELFKAIQLIRMSKEFGPSIDSRWETATQQSEWCRHAYDRGFQDGVEREHERIKEVLNND